MNVFSAFDGMSCGQIALERANIKVDNYYASEIKPHGIEVAKYNYPNTIHLGDITKIKAEDLPQIDILIGGSPCQDLSRGHSEREGLEGQKSSLFWEFVRLYNELKPKYFFLENVVMPAIDKEIITRQFCVEPIQINIIIICLIVKRKISQSLLETLKMAPQILYALMHIRP